MNADRIDFYANQLRGIPTAELGRKIREILRDACSEAAAAERRTCEIACAQAIEYARRDEREACASVVESPIGKKLASLCDGHHQLADHIRAIG